MSDYENILPPQYCVKGIAVKDDASGQRQMKFTNREEDYDEGEEGEEDEEYEEGDEEEEDEGGHTVRPSGNTRACKRSKTYIEKISVKQKTLLHNINIAS